MWAQACTSVGKVGVLGLFPKKGYEHLCCVCETDLRLQASGFLGIPEGLGCDEVEASGCGGVSVNGLVQERS